MDQTAQIISSIYQDYGTQQFSKNWVAQDWPLYDMVGYTSSTLFQFFVNAAGTNDPVLAVKKTSEQTNLGTSGQIGGDYYYIATHIRLHVLNSAKARQTGTNVSTDTNFSARQLPFSRFMSALTSQGVLTVLINQKKILIENQPFQTFGGGFGLGVVVPPAVGTGAATAINNGGNAYAATTPYDIDGGAIGDPYSLAMPLVFAPSTTFEIQLSYPLAASPAATNIYGASTDQTATVWLACILSGQKVRPRS